MLKLDKVNVAYGDVQVLWDISFEVKEKEFVVLIGANGAGKSTALKTICGLLTPQSGTIELEGQRVDRIPPYKIVSHGIALIPEARRLFPEMTVKENLEMGSLNPAGKAKRKHSMAWIFELFPILKERQRQLAGTLSGGEQQMVAVARGLMSRPRLLMFDEPSLGLAPLLVQEIFRITQRIKDEGVTILMVEQNVRHTLAICDRAYVLENGRITMEGKGCDLLKDKHVKEAYLGI
jgi:branched-chain amino acid transport system ATP-binding protein